jgi:hypothetical protein
MVKPPQRIAHRTATVSNWRAVNALDSTKQKLETLRSSRHTIDSATRFRKPSEEMNQSFDSYETYKRDLQPKSSKVEYRNFLTLMQNKKNSYDSNISNVLEYNRKLIAFKDREQG